MERGTFYWFYYFIYPLQTMWYQSEVSLANRLIRPGQALPGHTAVTAKPLRVSHLILLSSEWRAGPDEPGWGNVDSVLPLGELVSPWLITQQSLPLTTDDLFILWNNNNGVSSAVRMTWLIKASFFFFRELDLFLWMLVKFLILTTWFLFWQSN